MRSMDYRDYIKRIRIKIGEANAADRIEEGSWLNIVVKELNNISNDCAKELEKEIGGKWDKGSYMLGLNEAPPTRLLALEIVLASWLGWVMQEKQGYDGQVPVAFVAAECGLEKIFCVAVVVKDEVLLSLLLYLLFVQKISVN